MLECKMAIQGLTFGLLMYQEVEQLTQQKRQLDAELRNLSGAQRDQFSAPPRYNRSVIIFSVINIHAEAM